MRRLLTPLAALVCSALISMPANAAQVVTRQQLGLSDYRYFKVYPHLARARQALKENNEARAIGSFKHAHEMAPQSVRITLWLAEAYRHFGHDDKARALLDEQLRKTPNDKDARLARDVIPLPEQKVETAAALHAQQIACDANPSLQCRSEVGRNAIRLAQLNVAKMQLSDLAFRHSSQGRALADELSQRAIFLQQWRLADQSFALLDEQQTLSEAQYQQWFGILLFMQRDERILDLQRQGVMNTPAMQLAYAQSLAQRKAIKPLRRYLSRHNPVFASASEEHNWLGLLATYGENPGKAVASREIKYPQNRQYILTTLLPVRMQQKDWQGASQLLSEFPPDAVLEQRLDLHLAQQDRRQSVRMIEQISRSRRLSARQLDSYSFHLVTFGEARAASALLLEYWPFTHAGGLQKTLADRLYALLVAHPQWLSAKDKARLAQPLPAAEQRMRQARLFTGAENCAVVMTMLGDFAQAYDAPSWSRLAECYQQTSPGLALYAAQRAVERDPTPYYRRQAACLAFSVEDYDLARDYWAKIPAQSMTDDDVVAAARSARLADDDGSLTYWQEIAWQRAMPEINFTSAPYQDDAEKGFALLRGGNVAGARRAFEKALRASPDSPEILRQLAYVNQRLDDKARTRFYSRRVVDDIDNAAAPRQGLTDEQKKERFALRRVDEDTARRWTFSFDASPGLTKSSGAGSGSDPHAPRDKSNRSYGQAEAEYRIGRNQLFAGDLLSAYGRTFAGSGGHTNIAPVYQPMLGLGVRWQPLHEQIFYLALEQQLPLDRHEAKADVMLRASASFLNGGKFSDDWHPVGRGWFAQNLYLDAAHYVKQDYQLYTADYRVSWHHKISDHQTLEPYAHAQYNAAVNTPDYENGDGSRFCRDSALEGAGVRLNHWFGETRYQAFPHKASLGLEYQYVSAGHRRETNAENNLFLTLGVRW
ncbi:NfrA family protein [Dryocola sp. BD586]|uniref:NfrA family protein n=1 Tax=Dryocola sp. BD586 TaxID=3133271 RepID=UPI003F500B16